MEKLVEDCLASTILVTSSNLAGNSTVKTMLDFILHNRSQRQIPDENFRYG